MKLLSQRQALNSMLGLLSIVMVFHLLVIFQLIPYSIVWAGKLNNVKEMLQFEVVSILLLLVNILVFLLKGGYISHKIPVKFLNWIIVFYTVIFFLNTIGNLFAKSNFEFYVFTPLTLISALLCLRVVIETKENN